MWRFLAGVASSLLLMAGGFFVWTGMAQEEENPLPPAPVPALAEPQSGPPPTPPAADERTKEQKRFDRADRDNDERITLEELYHPRRRAFARLDRNGDGRLAFEEWAVTTSEKFTGADSDRDRFLTRTEYATTAPRRRSASRRASCAC